MAVRDSVGKATGSAKETARKGTRAAKGATRGAATTVKETSRKATGSARATKAARAGRVEEARRIAADADLGEGPATKAIDEAEALHYEVAVNKRGLSAGALTKTLNDRWANGWRLLHLLEQRGNTVIVFEKRS